MKFEVEILCLMFFVNFTCGFNIDTSCKNVIVPSVEVITLSHLQTNFNKNLFFGYSMFLEYIKGENEESIQ